jgi:hypothetical protein
MPHIRRSTALLLALIVLVSVGLRLIQLDTAPWGGHGDVAWIGINALDWVDGGVFPYYVFELYAPEPMIVQVVALLQTVFGPSFFTSRLATVIFGVLLIVFLFPATWWLIGDSVESHQRERASLLASLAGAMSMHAIYISRLGMRAALFPALLALVVWLTVWAWRTGGWWRWTIAGASLALMQYNYIPARLVPLILALWFTHDVIFNRDHWRKSIRGWVIMAVTSFILTLPNIITFLSTPESFSARADAGSATTGGWAWQYTDSFSELLSIIAQKIILEIQAIGIYWDGPYNVMNSPMLTPLFAIGFGVALLMALRFPRRIVYWWSLLGLPIMLATDLISGAVVEIHSVRQSGVLTFMFILGGVGVADLWTWLEGRFSKSIVSTTLLLLAIVPTVLSIAIYLNEFIPAGYVNPESGWRDEQIDVDLSNHILDNPGHSYLLSYEEYSRSNIAYMTAYNYRNRHSAIDTDGQLNIPNPPEDITVMIATDPYRIRHSGREAQWYQRAWVLLHEAQTYLLPPFTPEQTDTLFASIEDTDPEPYVDRSDTHIADFYTLVSPPDIFRTRDVIDTPLDAIFSLPASGTPQEIKLQGYTISQDELVAGDIIFVTLYWQALQQASEDYEVFVQILDGRGEVVGSTHDFPYNGMYRSRIWKTDELTSTHHWLKLSDELPVGRYTLNTGLYRMLHNEPLHVEGTSANASQDAVLAADLRVPAPSPENTVSPLDTDIHFGEYLQLSGLDIMDGRQTLAFGDTWTISKNGSLQMTFDWTVLERPDRDYSLFIHMTPTDSPTPIAQADIALGINSYPTGTWRAGDRQQDSVTLNLLSDTASGGYDVWVGIYHYMDNTRLTPILEDKLSLDDRLLLGHIIVN